MVRIDQYIRSLLFEHDCVIIPDFGGLLTRHSEAGYIIGRGIYAPPRKKIGFNEILKLDDGVLIYTISIHEKISREEALHLVREYVDNLKIRLSGGEEVELKGIGVFHSNQEGKVVFEPDNISNFDADWYGFTEIPVKALLQETEIPEEVYQRKIFPANPEGEKENNKSIFKWTGWAAVITGLLFFVGAFGESLSNSQGSANPFQAINPVNIYTGLSELVNEFRDDKSNTSPLVETYNLSTIQDPMVEPASELDNQETLVDEYVSVEKIPSITAKKYELIVGSFTTMEAAEALRMQLVDKGYTSAYIIDRAQRRFHKVAALGTDNLNEAYTLRNKLEKVAGKGVWVFEDKSGKDRQIL